MQIARVLLFLAALVLTFRAENNHNSEAAMAWSLMGTVLVTFIFSAFYENRKKTEA